MPIIFLYLLVVLHWHSGTHGRMVNYFLKSRREAAVSSLQSYRTRPQNPYQKISFKNFRKWGSGEMSVNRRRRPSVSYDLLFFSYNTITGTPVHLELRFLFPFLTAP